MPVTITRERPDTSDALALISELDAYLAPLYPPSSQHGFSPGQLISEDVAFFVIRYAGMPAACGGVKLFYRDFGEVKRMYVRPQFRGKGLGKMMLRHLEEYAREHGIGVLRLETGVSQPEAIGLYERMGYWRIPPFTPYTEDPLSVFYEKCIARPPGDHSDPKAPPGL